MTRSAPKEKLTISTRKPRPKGDMFANLRKPDEIDSLSIEDLIPVERRKTNNTPINSTPVEITPVVSTRVQSPSLHLQKNTDVETTPHVESTRVRGFLRVPNEVVDRILPTLKTSEQAVLLRLYRLSHGYGKSNCKVGLPTLATACNLSVSQIRIASRTLEARGLIQISEVANRNYDKHHRGTIYEVLPNLPTASLPTGVKSTGVDSTGVVSTPNKENTLKDTHNTEAGVRVSSRFTLAECRKYADSLRADGITNPGGYATKIHRSGEADESVAAFLEPVESAKSIDASLCPDCHGTGFYEPGGAGKGVAKCKHEQLFT